jgi:predicted dinucleotide-binding enzyme
MYLVELTGFDAVDGGPIAESWRQQPGSPAYTTELKAEELLTALARAAARVLLPSGIALLPQ